jgi:hypothetical protein
MSKFLKLFRDGLEGIKQADLKSPDDEVAEGETVVGVLESDDVKKLWVLRGRLADECEALDTELTLAGLEKMKKRLQGGKAEHDPATCPVCRLRSKKTLLNERGVTVNRMFWTALWHELDDEGLGTAAAGGAIGLRKNWQIVVPVGSPDTSIPELAFLEALLGIKAE